MHGCLRRCNGTLGTILIIRIGAPAAVGLLWSERVSVDVLAVAVVWGDVWILMVVAAPVVAYDHFRHLKASEF